MTRLAVNDFFPPGFPVHVSDVEIKNKTTIPTYFLMKQFERDYGHEHDFHFIIGSDLLPTLKKWHEGEKLLHEINFILYNRKGYEIETLNLEPELMPKKYVYRAEAKDYFGMISSTEVRRRIEEARKLELDDSKFMNIIGMVTKGVAQYIIENRLY